MGRNKLKNVVFSKNEERRKSKLKIIGVIILGLIVISAIASSSKGEQDKKYEVSNNSSLNETSQSSQIEYIFDTPLLIGKNIDEVRLILGQPIDKDIEPTDLNKQAGIDEWLNTFEKDGYELSVSYDINTRAIKDLFVSGDYKSGYTTDQGALKTKANISNLSGSNYTVEFVRTLNKNDDDNNITGIKIIKK
jgi:hypothetical protein